MATVINYSSQNLFTKCPTKTVSQAKVISQVLIHHLQLMAALYRTALIALVPYRTNYKLTIFHKLTHTGELLLYNLGGSQTLVLTSSCISFINVMDVNIINLIIIVVGIHFKETNYPFNTHSFRQYYVTPAVGGGGEPLTLTTIFFYE